MIPTAPGRAENHPATLTREQAEVLQTRNLDKVMMLAATLARMGVGLITFVVMARYLGPENFGVIGTAVAYATFINIVTDYGLSVSTMRLAAANPDCLQETVSKAFGTKFLLTGAVTAIVGVVAFALIPPPRLPIFIMTYLGTAAYAFADLTMIAARARRRFDLEAAIVVVTSIVMMAVVAGTAYASRNSELTALAFMITRLLYLAIAKQVLRRQLGIRIDWLRPFSEVWTTLRLSSGYAADSILTTLSSQIDVLIFGVLLSSFDIGIYQAGARLVQVIMPFAVVLSTVYLPVLSATAINGEAQAFRHNARRITFEFTGLAIVIGLGFVVLGPLFTQAIYGEHYSTLMPLWTGFGLFALLRLMASAYGIQLVALGAIKERLFANVATLAVFLVAAQWAIPRYGLPAAAWVLAASSITTVLILAGALIRSRAVGLAIPVCSALAICIIGMAAMLLP